MNQVKLYRWPGWIARTASGLVFVMATVVLLGWASDISVLKSVLPQWTKMSPLTALTFALTGVALWSAINARTALPDNLAEDRRKAVWRFLAQGCAGIVTIIGLFRLCAYLLHWNFAPDQLWFHESSRTGAVPIPARMAPGTALNFLLLGLALVLSNRPRYTGAFQFPALAAGLLGWAGFSHYLYGGEPLLPYAQMAVHTALAFLILSAGILCSRKDGGLMTLLTSDSPGGVMARRLVPSVIVVPVLMGWLRLQGQRAGWYGTEAGISVFALANMTVFGALIWASARLLHLTDSERKKAAEALHESRELLQSVINNTTTVVYVKDLSGQYRLINKRFEELFHVTLAGLAGKTDYDLFTKEQANAFRAVDERVAASGQMVEAEEIAPLDDGLHTYISIKFPLRDATGKTYAVGGLSTDITERKHAEKIREQLAAIVESSDDAIISKTREGIITSWNPGAKKLFGYPAEEAIGRPIQMLFPPERANEEPEILARIGRGESVDHFETVRIRKDGVRIDVSVTLSPIRDGQGKITGASKIARDITERKHTEAKLQAQLSRLDLLSQTTRAIGERQDLKSIFQVVIRSVEDNLPVDFGCICLHDQASNGVRVTSVGAKSHPLALELAMSEQAFIPIDQNGMSRCVRGQLVYEPDISEVEFPFPQRLARGGLRSLVIAPLLVESSVFGVFVAGRREARSFSSTDCEFLRQLSEHVGLAAHQAQLYGALQQAYDDLRQTQQAVMQQERLRALGQMASGIAHDINNAISPVALYTQSLLEREPNLSERARNYLETIKRAIDDVAATVARMKEFYRQREQQLAQSALDVNRLVEQVTDLTRARWSDMPQQRGIVIEMAAELATDLPTIRGVESEIREALINLVFNAVDAMPEGGRLTLRTKTAEGDSGRRVDVEVADTGIGMDENTRRRCLEPFFTTKGERGTGLGLAMVYGMVKRHGAEIEIESEAGRGTTVRLSFSASAAAMAGPEQPGKTYTIPSRLRILVVDDDPLLLKSLRDTLEEDGHAVVTANGGETGLETFRAALERKEVFSIVITDLGMPNMDGRKVASAVKGLSPSTPVILLTGWGQRLVDEQDIPAHVDRVLNKPPKLPQLREALAFCCKTASS